ncbi:hypothetical protein [Gryllotalpicola ginsengisoli]|uniref:hypothetical protein n=1 Tax=Gryllotalpicola ginsengisoli TaxID=444608 RepID=UPI0003B4354F|nr:hypothetical protein [Gryllotalpicola ginsengisoli]
MKKPSARVRSLVGFGAVPLAIALAGGLVWQSSYAAFTATTRNAGDSWSTGSVALTDDDKGAAAFDVTNLVPGQSGEKCIVVTSNSNVAGVVKDYAANVSSTTGLAEHIDFMMQAGTGGSFNSCEGFQATSTGDTFAPMSTVAASSYDYDHGGHVWSVSGSAPESRTYKVSWKFDTTGMTQQQIDALQGTGFTADLVWEFRTTAAAQ